MDKIPHTHLAKLNQEVWHISRTNGNTTGAAI